MNTIIKLFLGIFIISWSSILIRWLGDVHPLVISFYRLFFSALFILPFILKKLPSQRKNVTKFFPYIFFAGLFLALHFYTWISSLQMTTVGNSIFLESTHPLFGLLLSIIILKEKGSKYFIPALILGLALYNMSGQNDLAWIIFPLLVRAIGVISSIIGNVFNIIR